MLTGDVRVTVVGTRFSVRHTPSTPGHPGVHVGVASGHVRVGPEHPAGWWEFWRPDRDRYATDLTAGQQVTVGESGLPGRVARIDQATGQDGSQLRPALAVLLLPLPNVFPQRVAVDLAHLAP